MATHMAVGGGQWEGVLCTQLCFVPPQQKMTQKILKMIQGDYIEKPDFALKSIGQGAPVASWLCGQQCSLCQGKSALVPSLLASRGQERVRSRAVRATASAELHRVGSGSTSCLPG